MLNNIGLGFVFTARDFASAKMTGLERRFTSLDEKVTGGTARMTAAFKQIGIGLGVLVAGAITLTSGLALAGAAGKFEQGIASVGAVTRATTHELEGLREAAIKAGIETQFSPDDAVAGLQSLATAGQTATQSTQTLVPVLDLAAGSLGQLGVAEAAEAVVGTLNAYGRAAEQSAGVTDKLLRITQLSNFQARDFGVGLSKAAAAGATFGQELSDVLITMGLLRSRNIDASSSATAFREAVRRVGADSRAQQAVLGAGVDVFDRTSRKMRSIIDIMSDFSKATVDMSDEERNRRITQAFGARGLFAFNAVQKAAFTTTKDGTEVVLKGAAAIAAMREQMSQAEGTAASFREKLLDTFEGQKTLLRGTLQTFAVVLGEPFAAVFKPIVGAVVGALNTLLKAFKAIPKPIKELFAGFVTAIGAVLTLVGGVLMAKGAIALFGIALKAIGVTLGGLAIKMLPVLLVIGALAAAVAVLRLAIDRNLGGIGDFFARLKARTTLIWNGLQQLFKQGGFSGAIREELGRAENQGIKQFLIGFWKVAHRVRKAWAGFREGFESALAAMRPVFVDLKEAFVDLGREISGAISDVTGSAENLPFDTFTDFARGVGSALAGVVRWFAKLYAELGRIAAGVISGFRSMKEYIGPAIDTISGAIDDLKRTWSELVGSTNEATGAVNESTAGWKSVGEVIGAVLGGIVTFIGLVIGGLLKVTNFVLRVIAIVRDIFVATGTTIGEGLAALVWWFTEEFPDALSYAWGRVTNFFSKISSFFSAVGRWFTGVFASITGAIQRFWGRIVGFFSKIQQAIRSVVDSILNAALGLLRKIPDALLPASLERLKHQSLSATVRSEREPDVDQPINQIPAALSVMPSAAETNSRTNELAMMTSMLAAVVDSKERGDQNVNINLEVDGETIARASHKASRDAAGRAFSPVPVY